MKTKMLEAGVRQKEMARKVGMPQPNFSDLVNGRRTFSIDQGQQIAKGLN